MVNVVKVDYHNREHMALLVTLLNDYARDPMGGNQALKSDILESLPEALAERNFMHSFIVFSDEQPAGFANCIESFSTFYCKPVLNIHDFALGSKFRGQQLSQRLLSEIERFACRLGCCKLTLEVLEGNKVAQNAYIKAGFNGYELDPALGKALFWEKKLA